MKSTLYYILHISIFNMAILLTGCGEDLLPLADNGIDEDEPIAFTTYLPASVITRSTVEEDAFRQRMGAYKAVVDDYRFSIEMFEDGIPDAIGSGVYQPEEETDGNLLATAPLYWPGNTQKVGFKATAGTVSLESDQTTKAKLLLQDQLLGYGFMPLWNESANAPVDDEDALNYRTFKEWYSANKELGMAPSGQDEVSYYKRIPLFLRHQRALVTIRLKAGEGVNPEDLTFDKAKTNISTKIFSYAEGKYQAIKPLANKTSISYDPSADEVETTEYTAVVNPYDYRAKATADTIAEIKLSEQRFTFFAGNDENFADDDHMKAYELHAGQHLVITVILGRGSRKVVITSYVEDWTETVTTSVVDDYGQAGDLIQITTRKELYDFLTSKENKQGNVAIIVPNAIDLEKDGDAVDEWTPQPLNCTLNMAGATFHTNHPVFSTISSSGTIVNGTITVGNTHVASAIAETNLGKIERIDVFSRDAEGKASTGYATQAGLVVVNSGTITACSSVLPVHGSTGFVGGIASRSIYAENGSGPMPVIDGCTVNARVDGSDGVKGGGIVGEAVGRVTGNTFIYGITVSQSAADFKNIVQSKAGDKDLRAYNNAWPTNVPNAFGEVENPNMTVAAEQYDGVLDRQNELELLLTSAYNKMDKHYRLSDSFSMSDWTYGKRTDILNSSDAHADGNVLFHLDGNDMTITTDGMLFSNVMGTVRDLTVRLSSDLITEFTDGTDAIAALAYAVTGSNAKISNIKVKAGAHRIQASNAGGIVVWAYDGATVEDCQCKANIQIWVNGIGDGARIYAGGIVACAAKATITRCVYYNADATLFRNTDPQIVKGTLTTPVAGIDSKGIYYGGILGGTAEKESVHELPSILITDCTSWFVTSKNNKKGSVVGYALDTDGIAEGCQGNWWPGESDGVGTYPDGKSVEQLIGRRNSITPAEQPNYDD